jgi:hypothetical protein
VVKYKMGINKAHSSNNGCLKVNLKPKVLPMKALHFTSYKIIKKYHNKEALQFTSDKL